MYGGEFIREARKRAGMTQRELAESIGTTQPVIARWEAGQVSPAFARVVEAVRACGLDLAVRVVSKDVEHSLWVEKNLRLTPIERLTQLREGQSAIDRLAAKVTSRDQRGVRS